MKKKKIIKRLKKLEKENQELKRLTSIKDETELDTDFQRGEPVVAKWGYNDITKRPFEFLYDFAYFNSYGNVIVYTHGECSMQDAHCFKKEEIRRATAKDLKENFWGH